MDCINQKIISALISVIVSLRQLYLFKNIFSMNKNFKILFGALLMLFVYGTSFAHTMWLETALKGEKGTAHKVCLYFGEFSMADRTPLKGWLADMEKGRWEVLTPSGNVIRLEPTAADPCYIATFVPEEEGWYRIHYDCWVPQLWKGSKLHYQSITWVQVGNSDKGLERTSPFDQGISFLPAKEDVHHLGQPSLFPIATNNGEYKGIKINILGDNGWSKNYYRYPDGMLSFVPIWSGHYLMNATKTRPLTEEEIQKYPDAKSVYDMITYFFEV